jgi:hypothetical protein
VRAREVHWARERIACQLLGRRPGAHRHEPTLRTNEDALTRAIVALAGDYHRYVYRKVTTLWTSSSIAGTTSGHLPEGSRSGRSALLENRGIPHVPIDLALVERLQAPIFQRPVPSQ